VGLSMASKEEKEAMRRVREAAQKDRERILMQDRVDQTHAEEMRRTETALAWQRNPRGVIARRSSGPLRVLYYILLTILTIATVGVALVVHVIVKKLFFDKKSA